MKTNILKKLLLIVVIVYATIYLNNLYCQGLPFGKQFEFSTNYGIAYIPDNCVKRDVDNLFIDFPYYWGKNRINIYNDEKNNRITDTIFSASGKKVDVKPTTPILLGVKLNPKLTYFSGIPVTVLNSTYRSYIISDSTEATIIALGINEKNKADYEFHVVENDSVEIVPWTSISKFEHKFNYKKPYALIGRFSRPGSILLIEVINKKNYKIKEGVLLDWRSTQKPKITNIEFATRYSFFSYTDTTKSKEFESIKIVGGIVQNLIISSEKIRLISLTIEKNPTILYSLFIEKTKITGQKETSTLGENFAGGDFWFTNYYFNEPGKYKVIVRPSGNKVYSANSNFEFPFEVISTNKAEKKYTIKEILTKILGFITVIIVGLILYFLYNKRKLKTANRLKEKSELQLKSIRAQLNPHFMFNALNSIQNLMNKNDVDAANHYLTIFSSLTRKVLDTSENEIISLDEEILLLNDYLQMEQLRFGFNFSIKTDDTLNKANIEIPTMLLQPFVENAVKHGISILNENGIINISILQKNKKLVLSVTDNGKGFDETVLNTENKGWGIKLSKQRIELLNAIYPKQSVTLNIENTKPGTNVTVTLDNWL